MTRSGGAFEVWLETGPVAEHSWPPKHLPGTARCTLVQEGAAPRLRLVGLSGGSWPAVHYSNVPRPLHRGSQLHCGRGAVPVAVGHRFSAPALASRLSCSPGAKVGRMDWLQLRGAEVKPAVGEQCRTRRGHHMRRARRLVWWEKLHLIPNSADAMETWFTTKHGAND